MKIMFLGDVHGNDKFFTQAVKVAAADGCHAVIQVGDFGYWEHAKEGKSFLKWCERYLQEKGLTLYWLDGNHENHSVLRANYGPGGDRHKPTPEGFWQMRSNIFYLPRGVRWNWEGVDFMALGGAYSIDKDWRTEGKSWWPEERITAEEAEYASRPGNVDVMLTHDCPDGVDIPCLRAQQKNRYPESQDNRSLVASVVRAVRPILLVHGHYHERYSQVLAWPYDADDNGLIWHKTLVEGLACDWEYDNRAYISMDLRQIEDIKRRQIEPVVRRHDHS